MLALQDRETFLKTPQSLFLGQGQDGCAGGRVSHSPHLSPNHAARAGGGRQAGRQAGKAASLPARPCRGELLCRSRARCERDPGQPGSLHCQPSPHATWDTRIWSKFQQAKRGGSSTLPSAAPFLLGTMLPSAFTTSLQQGSSPAGSEHLSVPSSPWPAALFPVPFLPTAFLTTVPPTCSGDAQQARQCTEPLPPPAP